MSRPIAPHGIDAYPHHRGSALTLKPLSVEVSDE